MKNKERYPQIQIDVSKYIDEDGNPIDSELIKYLADKKTELKEEYPGDAVEAENFLHQKIWGEWDRQESERRKTTLGRIRTVARYILSLTGTVTSDQKANNRLLDANARISAELETRKSKNIHDVLDEDLPQNTKLAA